MWGWYDLLQQVKEKNWIKSCLEIQISDLAACGKMSSSCHARRDADLPTPGVQEGPAGLYPCRTPVPYTQGTVTLPRQRAQKQPWAVNFNSFSVMYTLSSWGGQKH